MANSLVTPDIVAQGMLAVMHNACPLISRVDRQYDKSFGEGAEVEGNKPGPTLRLRKPIRPTVTRGAALDVQPVTEETELLVQSTRLQTSLSFSCQELTLITPEQFPAFAKRYIEPAAKRLASEVERELTGVYKSVYNVVGTDGTMSSATLISGRSLLSNYAVPTNDRFGVLTPEHSGAMIQSMQTFYNPQSIISKNFVEGALSSAYGADYYEDQNLYTHTNGTRGATDSTVYGGSQTGSSLTVQGAITGQIFNKGDTFTVDGVYLVNYETKALTTTLQPFVITSDTTASSTSVALPISPAITTSGYSQTVSGSPSNGAQLRFQGAASSSHQQSMVMHKSAIVMASTPLYKPQGVDFAGRADGEGMSIRIVRDYVIMSDILPIRCDILMGVAIPYPFTACRLWS